METLYTYLNTYNDWDGHIHLFNHKKILPRKPGFHRYVGFMDIEYDDVENINVLNAYSNYIDKHYNQETDILLATGLTIEDIKSVHEKYPDIIKGFGELKCYDSYKGENIPYKKIGFVRQVVNYSSKHGSLPVYVHWEFNNSKDVKKLENIIQDYPTVPLVICHLGMNEYNKDIAFVESMRLQKQYNNVWLDISWCSFQYLIENMMRLNNLDTSRIILGSDFNNKLFSKNHDKNKRKDIVNKFLKIKEYLRLNNSKNIRSLFFNINP